MNTDFQLIKKYLAGDNKAFEQLYNFHRVKLYNYINYLLGPAFHDHVDDIYQQTWLDAIKRFPKFKDKGSFYSWILRIAHSRFIDHCRKNKVTFSELPEMADLRQMPSQHLQQEEEIQQLYSFIDRLPHELKEVVLLRKEAIPFKEIALIQDVSINTVLSRMNYALKNLRRMFRTETDRG